MAYFVSHNYLNFTFLLLFCLNLEFIVSASLSYFWHDVEYNNFYEELCKEFTQELKSDLKNFEHSREIIIENNPEL
jgi:hypothetical protein